MSAGTTAAVELEPGELAQVRGAGVVVARHRGAERGGGGVRRQRGGADELAALRPGLDRLARSAALQVLREGQEPLGPAVVPLARRGGSGDGDRVPGNGHVVVDLCVLAR